jgi:hypothetical protein
VLAVSLPDGDPPAPGIRVILAAFEFGARPVAQFQGFNVRLEPSCQFVLGDVGRPVRRERHERQVIDVRLIVQGQRVIALAPMVAYAPRAIDD